MSGPPNRRLIIGGIVLSVVLMLTVTVILFSQEIRRLQEEKAQRATVMGELPDFALVDQTGETVTRADLIGKVNLVSFVFTRCAGPCPDLTRQMGRIRTEWATVSGVQFVTITVDPEYDTVPILADYAERMEGNGGRWVFLTGEPERVLDLVRNGFRSSVEPSDDDHQILHSQRFAVVDRRGRIRAYLDGSRDRVIEDAAPIVKRLLAEN